MSDEALTGVRVREVIPGEGKYYIVVCGDGEIVEVSVVVPDENQFSQRAIRSDTQTIAALATLASKYGADPKEILATIGGSIVCTDGKAAMIGRAIQTFIERENENL